MLIEKRGAAKKCLGWVDFFYPSLYYSIIAVKAPLFTTQKPPYHSRILRRFGKVSALIRVASGENARNPLASKFNFLSISHHAIALGNT
jgi:hypothetical protein